MTRAANSLHLTQPTLSRQLRELEEELGVKLLNRHSQSVSLTAEGMRLRKRAEEVLEMVGKTCAEFADKGNAITGDIYIGGGETRIMRLIADIIGQIRLDYPDVHIHLHSGNSQDVTERLDKGLLDFGILIQPADLSKYDYVNLPEKDVWGVLTAKGSKLATKEKIGKSDLLDAPLILSRQAITRTKSQNTFLDWFGDDFDKLNVVGTFNLVYNAAILARAGVAHVITIGGLTDVSENSGLCFRELTPYLETGLNLVWKKHQVFSPAADIFLQYALDRFQEKETIR